MTGREERWQCDRRYACTMRSKIWSLPSQTNTKSRFDIDLKAVYAPVHISIATLKQRGSSALITGREHTQMAAVFHKSTHACYILIPHQAQTVAPGSALSKTTFFLALTLHTHHSQSHHEGSHKDPNTKSKDMLEATVLGPSEPSMSLAVSCGFGKDEQSLLASSACCVEVLLSQLHRAHPCPHNSEKWEEN